MISETIPPSFSLINKNQEQQQYLVHSNNHANLMFNNNQRTNTILRNPNRKENYTKNFMNASKAVINERLSSSDVSEILILPSVVSSPATSSSSRTSDYENSYQKPQNIITMNQSISECNRFNNDNNNNNINRPKQGLFEQENRLLKKLCEMKQFADTEKIQNEDEKKHLFDTNSNTDSLNSNLNTLIQNNNNNNNNNTGNSRCYLRTSAV
jgi:hypothetical protein